VDLLQLPQEVERVLDGIALSRRFVICPTSDIAEAFDIMNWRGVGQEAWIEAMAGGSWDQNGRRGQEAR
jgi:hypothetical protein